MGVVNIEGLNKSYGKTKVLSNVNLSLEQGDRVVIMGASGSGKSTLLYLMGGLEKSDKGRVLINDKDLSKLNDEQLASFRNLDIGFVFQFHFLLPTLDCLENILLPARLGKKDLEKTKTYTQGLARRLKVEECLSKYPYQISGGQQQRINLIRALSLKPKLLLCDEPTGNLDSNNSKIVVDLLNELSKEQNVTLVVVTHDEEVAVHFEKEIHMVDGVLH